ncbi:hypothetical protein SAMN06265222_101600 [Neorhodopirellula lusitana]|uniref:Uncharacterized protein n=1 Tax=Neorhodopirellula lusitana TaxID=445327 RepID=A0ABY1PQA0_9BACT|nr:hypothetical protein SAMN06265222_101600 [Neorhodopirellula lusitana]
MTNWSVIQYQRISSLLTIATGWRGDNEVELAPSFENRSSTTKPRTSSEMSSSWEEATALNPIDLEAVACHAHSQVTSFAT